MHVGCRMDTLKLLLGHEPFLGRLDPAQGESHEGQPYGRQSVNESLRRIRKTAARRVNSKRAFGKASVTIRAIATVFLCDYPRTFVRRKSRDLLSVLQ